MMAFLSWFLKYIVFPLIPMLATSTLRLIHGESFGLAVINPAELSFSTAMVCLFISTRTSSLSNQKLKKNIDLIFQISLCIFLIFFAWSLYIQHEIYHEVLSFFDKAGSAIKLSGEFKLKDLPTNVASNTKILDALRPIIVTFSVISLIASTAIGVYYDLDEN